MNTAESEPGEMIGETKIRHRRNVAVLGPLRLRHKPQPLVAWNFRLIRVVITTDRNWGCTDFQFVGLLNVCSFSFIHSLICSNTEKKTGAQEQ